jgi:acyl-CoA thioesterase II
MPDSFTELLDLTPHGIDAWVGATPSYDWGRVYGGQVVAQGLRAAAHTVDPRFGVHSVHAYFIRGGVLTEPIRYEVDRIRDGRSFLTRRVVARQSGGAILTMAASFQVTEEAHSSQPVAAPEAPAPQDCEDRTWSPLFEHRRAPLQAHSGRAISWMRATGTLADDPVVRSAVLAFLSDDTPMEAISDAHPEVPTDSGPGDHEGWMGASLDHAVWLHAPARPDRWLLFDLQTQRLSGSRGLAFGQVFDEDGVHVASIAQEGLLRMTTR